VLSTVALADRPEFAVTAVTCRDDHRGWSKPEVRADYRLVLVRRGRFRRSADGVLSAVDPTTAYLGVPGEEERFAHPAGGDVCTSVTLSPEWWRAMAGDTARPTRSTVYVDARLDLIHRQVLAAREVDYGLTETLLRLLAASVDQVVAGPKPSGSVDRALVTAARELINEGHPASAGLLPLAEQLDVSPYRLSRAFTREVGVSLTRYRNRVRVGRALDLLEAGERGLGVLAADLGFADQAHLTRTIREHVGHTPTALRRLLTA
jgi:AraC-like DNA-binding protein